MSQIIRFVNDCIEDLFLFNGEDPGHDFHHFEDNTPYPLRYGELHARVLHIPEDSANGLITGEPFGQGKQIVLQGRDRGCGKLRCEVPGLALAHTQQPLGFLEEDLEGPAHGINPIGFQELQGEVGRHYSIPGLLFSLHKIETYICARKANVSGNILTANLAAPSGFTPGFKQIDQCPGGEFLPFKTVFCNSLLPDLDHTQVMALDVPGTYEANHLRAGEPAVGKQVVKADALSNGSLYHGYHQLDLALPVLFCPRYNGGRFISILGKPRFELLVAHAEVVLPALLPEDGEVEDELALAIRDAQKERFETKDRLVSQVGIDPTDVFNTPSRFGKVGIVHHQANSLMLVVTSHANLVPYLNGEVVEYLAPIINFVVYETVENILFAAKEAA